MYVSSGTGTVSLTTYSNNSTYNDEWKIAKIGYMSETATLEGQETGSWWWVATARMFAQNYGSVPTSRNQNGAVATVFPHLDADEREAVQSGGIYAQATINYFLGEEITWLNNGDINPDCLSTVHHNKLVYYKDVVIDFIDDQQVLYIGRTTVYTNSNTGGYVDHSGHTTLIYGYVSIGSETYFLIRDPDPPTNNAAGVAPGTTKLMSHQQIYYHRYLDNNGYEIFGIILRQAATQVLSVISVNIGQR